MIDAQHTTFKRTHYLAHIYLCIHGFSISLPHFIHAIGISTILLHACVHRQHLTIMIAHNVSKDFETATQRDEEATLSDG